MSEYPNSLTDEPVQHITADSVTGEVTQHQTFRAKQPPSPSSSETSNLESSSPETRSIFTMDTTKTWSSMPQTRLSGVDDYEQWAEDIRDWLMYNSAEGLLDGTWTEPTAPTRPSVSQQALYDRELLKWKTANNRALAAMRMSMEAGPKNQTRLLTNAYDAWEKMKDYRQTGSVVFNHIVQEIWACDLSTSKDVTDFANRLRKLNAEAERIGPHCALPEAWLVQLFIKGLGPDFEHFVTSFNASHSIVGEAGSLPVQLDFIVKKASEHSTRTNRIQPVSINSVSTHNSAPSTPAFNNKRPRSSLVCSHCNKEGHDKPNCWDINGIPPEVTQRRAKDREENRRRKQQRTSRPAAARATYAADEDDPYTHATYGFMATSGSIDRQKWILDGGAQFHMTCHRGNFSSFDASFQREVKPFSDQPPIAVEGRGTIPILVSTPQGPKTIELRDVWYSPRFPGNLVSETTIYLNGLWVDKTKDGTQFSIKKDDFTLATGRMQDRTWYLDTLPDTTASARIAFELPSDSQSQLWHQRMAHLGMSSLEKLSKLADGMDLTSKIDGPVCDACIQGKARSHPHVHPIRPATKLLELLHMDICGPIPTPAFNKARYFLTITDDLSRFMWIYALQTKDEAYDLFSRFKEREEAFTGCRIRRIRSDNGGEFINRRFRKLCDAAAIEHETTVPYTPQQNGLAERQNQTIMERARCVIAAKDMPKALWPEIVTAISWLKNKCPVTGRDKSPYELYTGEKPYIGHVRILGSRCWIKTSMTKSSKLDDRAQERILVGYHGQTLYRVWNQAKGKVEKAHDVEFDEQPALKRPPDVDMTKALKKPRMVSVGDDEEEELSGNLDAASLEPPADLPEGDTITVRPANARRIEPVGELNLSPEDTLSHDFQEIPSVLRARANPTGDPQSYKQAMQSPDANGYRQACKIEYDSLVKMNTWKLVPRPSKQQVLKARWVLRRKTDNLGNEIKKKARWVVRGDLQEGPTPEETFSSVVTSMAYKLLFTRAATEDLEVEQMDVQVAFLNGEITEEIYVEQPEGFEDGTDRVCLLLRTLYGLKTSPRAWYITLKTFLQSIGFQPSAADHSVFVNEEMAIAVYVDDLLIFGPDRDKVQSVKTALSNRFSMTDLGPVKWYLGIDIKRDRQAQTITLSQQTYIQKVLEQFGMQDCSPDTLPMAPDAKLDAAPPDYIASDSFKRQYQSAVGSLMYAMLGTRPDIAYSVSLVSRFSSNPHETHWKAIKRILRYLKGTMTLVLIYRCTASPRFTAFTDASYGDCLVTRKSTAGYAFFTGSGAISWQSKRLSTISTSTTESEYSGQFRATLEALYLRNLASELWPSIAQQPTLIRGDNNGALSLAKNALGHARSKHFDIRLRKIQEVEEQGICQFQYVSTKDNVADILTKPLSRDLFQRHRESLGLSVPGNVPTAPVNSERALTRHRLSVSLSRP